MYAIRTIAVLLAVALAGAGCTVDSESVNQWDVNLFPLEAEWRLGDQLAAELAPTIEVVDDPVIADYVQALGDELVAHTELAEREWNFTVIEEDSVNAFAIPGGRIYVHTGLLEAVETEEQLLGVLAHEVSHGEARHGTERLTTTYGVALVAALVLGDDTGLIERIAAEIAAAGVFATFSRSDEREADRLGLVTLGEAGHDPEAMASFFGLLLAERTRRPTAVEQFFNSHPLTEDRIDDVVDRADEIEVAAGREIDPQDLAAVKIRLGDR